MERKRGTIRNSFVDISDGERSSQALVDDRYDGGATIGERGAGSSEEDLEHQVEAPAVITHGARVYP